MTVSVLVLLRVTRNWASSPSSTVSPAMFSRGSVVTGRSSSVMVPVAFPSWMVAPLGLLRETAKVSVCSSAVSSTVGTRMVFDASPGAKVRVADAEA